MKTKKLLIYILCTLTCSIVHAQDLQLYGTTVNGGDYAGGTIYKISSSGNDFADLYSFSSNVNAASDLLHASDGKFYGTLISGGVNGGGVLYSYDPADNKYSALHNFKEATGANPLYYGSLIQARNGKLYGTTTAGGAYGVGVIFSYDPANDKYADLFDFDTIRGAEPQSGLMQARNGMLYGMTYGGGANRLGVLFSYDIKDSAYTDLYNFDLTHGANPLGGVIQAKDSLLYGMTSFGGTLNVGNIFSYNIAGSAYIDLFDFDYAHGAAPLGNLMQASDGLLYGMTEQGGTDELGNIFSYDIAGDTIIDVLDFDFANGAYPLGSLAEGSNKHLYGMTQEGGPVGLGIIFSFNPANTNYADLFGFSGANGEIPRGSVVVGSDGKLFGTMANGGANSYGMLFSFDTDGKKYNNIYDFTGNLGTHPQDKMMEASDGNFYGMTELGGLHNDGVIYKFNPVTNKYADVFDFNGKNGLVPQGMLKEGKDRKLYGMTNAGGSKGFGVLFRFDPANNNYEDLVDFNGTDGAYPWVCKLVQAKSGGKMYGMTAGGGAIDYGVLFSYDPDNGKYKKLYDFSSNLEKGYFPKASLRLSENDSMLYGTTYFGGANSDGVLFTYNLTSNAYSDIYDFSLALGSNPHCTPVETGPGGTILYGTTGGGGEFGDGAIFSFNLTTSNYADVHDFAGADGFEPLGSLINASNGKLYGATTFGGSANSGVIFEFDPATQAFTKLFEFNGLNGLNPRDLHEYRNNSTNREEENSPGNSSEINNTETGFTIYPNPATGAFNVVISKDLTGGELEVFNIMGVKVYSEIIADSQKAINYNLSAGVYFLIIKSEDRQYVQKLVIQ